MEQLTPRANKSIALGKDYFGIGFEYFTTKKWVKSSLNKAPKDKLKKVKKSNYQVGWKITYLWSDFCEKNRIFNEGFKKKKRTKKIITSQQYENEMIRKRKYIP